ncbi:MAG TPA: anthranilate phosphoribosyltransferase [Candidatus Nitrosotenuis sp.]|nr:anthranilate phosphoribosyltransferase [Candidatus Nitrosotenuis sp.]
MLEELTKKIQGGQNLTEQEIGNAMDHLLAEGLSDSSKAEFLSSLTKKGETDDELFAMLLKMDQFSRHIEPKCDGTVIDVCGTGGDNLHTFNISTTASFVIASCGGFVAKHGNRSVSGISGSADIFEYFGYDLDTSEDKVTKMLEKFKIAFLFAQRFHPAMKNVAGARKLLGSRTAFNLLGPLTNPARVKNQLVGVFSDEYLERIISILKRNSSKNIMTVRSQDGLDELSTTSKNDVCYLHEGKIEKMLVDPEKLGLRNASLSDIQISSKSEAIKAFLSVLNGTASRPMIEVTMLNAAGGLMVANIAKDFSDGIELARQTIESGSTYSHFKTFVKENGNYEKIKEAEEL